MRREACAKDCSIGVAPKVLEVGDVKLNPADVGADVTPPFAAVVLGLLRCSMDVMCKPVGILLVDPPDLRFFAPG